VSLPIPNLDDKTFTELVEESRARIPRYAPGWTDHNLSDPGITFIDLFAWLAEMQIYNLNKVTDKNYIKFLNLIGTALRPAIQSKVDVTFSLNGTKENRVNIPEGTKVTTADKTAPVENIVFETDEDLTVTSIDLKKVITKDNSQWKDNSEYNHKDNIYFFAFGELANENNMLYLGFETKTPFPTEKIKLSINIYDADLPKINKALPNEKQKIIPSAKLEWEYCDGFNWRSLDILDDDTAALTRNGRITFNGPEDINLADIEDIEKKIDFFNEDQLYWLRVIINKAGYEIPPRIDTILLNTISTTHADTYLNFACQTFESTGLAAQAIQLSKPPIVKNSLKLEIKESNSKWQTWHEVENFNNSTPRNLHYTVDPSDAIITFGDGFRGRIPPINKKNPQNIKVTRFKLTRNSDTYSSTGLPFQKIKLRHSSIIKDSQIVEVRESDNQWHTWNEVSDFDASKPEDRHYIIDLENGVMTFGDGINGYIPQQAENNILVVKYTAGGGDIGNIAPYSIRKIADPPIYGITIKNRKSAIGGKNAESLAEAKNRIRKELKNRHRTVTSDDFEKLALSTPGIRVARAKALPLYHPQYPVVEIPNSVSIVVVPYILADNKKAYPEPGDGFLKTVCNHLKDKRLTTTKIHVIGPRFIKVNVKTSVKINPKMSSETVRINVEDVLKKFLDPLKGGPEKTGWPFGREVLKSEIYQVIENVTGVICVASISLSAEGCFKMINGNVKIPKIGLVYSGKFSVKNS